MSCLVEKFKYYVDLTKHEEARLEALEKETQSYKKRDTIFTQGDTSKNVYVIRNGWCASYVELADGGRQILNIHFPGDIVGTVTLPFEKRATGLMAATDVEVCPFPKLGVKEMFSESPKIAALFFAMATQDNIVLIDRLKAIGRMAGEDRLALLFLQLWARQKVTDRSIRNVFSMPLSQELLGDALGLTSVYVNRMLKQLQKDGYLALANKQIEIMDVDGLINRCEFEDRYYQLDVSWFPDK